MLARGGSVRHTVEATGAMAEVAGKAWRRPGWGHTSDPRGFKAAGARGGVLEASNDIEFGRWILASRKIRWSIH